MAIEVCSSTYFNYHCGLRIGEDRAENMFCAPASGMKMLNAPALVVSSLVTCVAAQRSHSLQRTSVPRAQKRHCTIGARRVHDRCPSMEASGSQYTRINTRKPLRIHGSRRSPARPHTQQRPLSLTNHNRHVLSDETKNRASPRLQGLSLVSGLTDSSCGLSNDQRRQ